MIVPLPKIFATHLLSAYPDEFVVTAESHNRIFVRADDAATLSKMLVVAEFLVAGDSAPSPLIESAKRAVLIVGARRRRLS